MIDCSEFGSISTKLSARLAIHSVVPKKQSHDQPVLEVIQAACSGDRISLG